MSLFDLDRPQKGLPEAFDWINSVGVLHHTADPTLALQRLAARLAPGGIVHLFLYGAIGRWEIRLLQEALCLLSPQDFPEGVRLGRDILAALPEQNRLVQRERSRWQLENQRDECFADMYLHPHEVDFTIDSLFALIDASGLVFAGFSNPEVWHLERLLGRDPELCQRAGNLPDRQRYRLIELLDTDIAHYEFFLFKPPLPMLDWQRSPWPDYFPRRNPCLSGWEEGCAFDQDYRVVHLTAAEVELLRLCDRLEPIAAIAPDRLNLWQSLVQRRLVFLAPPDNGG
jgi:SAM-dependent methyltransferase